MYNSFELIQSKSTFKIQKYANAVLRQGKHLQHSVVSEIGNCGMEITNEMIVYHEQKELINQLDSLKRFSFNVAKFTALLPHIPGDLILFPPVDEMSRWSNDFYYALQNEYARKKGQYYSLRKFN